MPEHVDMSQKWRIASMERRLCWVYPFLNVALPFTVASSCVGERVCACISVCQCVPMWVCVCECVFVRVCGCFLRVWVCLWTWLYMPFVCLDGLRTDVGARHFKKRMSETFSSVSDVRVVCRRSSRVMNKWSDREGESEGETEKHGEKKRSGIIPFGEKHISQKMSTTNSCRRVCVLSFGCANRKTEKKTFTGAGWKTSTRRRFITVVSILSIIYIRAATNDYLII